MCFKTTNHNVGLEITPGKIQHDNVDVGQDDTPALPMILPGPRRPSGWAWTLRCISGGALWTEVKTLSSYGCVTGH